MYQHGRALDLVAEYNHTYDNHAHHRFDREFDGEQHPGAVLAELASFTRRPEFRLAAVMTATVAAALAVAVL